MARGCDRRCCDGICPGVRHDAVRRVEPARDDRRPPRPARDRRRNDQPDRRAADRRGHSALRKRTCLRHPGGRGRRARHWRPDRRSPPRARAISLAVRPSADLARLTARLDAGRALLGDRRDARDQAGDRARGSHPGCVHSHRSVPGSPSGSDPARLPDVRRPDHGSGVPLLEPSAPGRARRSRGPRTGSRARSNRRTSSARGARS